MTDNDISDNHPVILSILTKYILTNARMFSQSHLAIYHMYILTNA